jgi:hypothetical protein
LVHAVKIVSDQNKERMVWRWRDYRGGFEEGEIGEGGVEGIVLA